MSYSVEGKIIKGIAGFYYVYVEGFGVVECKAKGLFRSRNIKPLPGDIAEVALTDENKKTGNIVEIRPRLNELVRPAVANVDQAMVVFAFSQPEPHLNLLDRFLIRMEKQEIPVIIVFNKKDLTEEDEAAHLRQIYEKSGYTVLEICAAQGIGTDEVRLLLDNKTTVLAGPSGVGKSTLVNLMQPDEKMETGAVSEKIKRGRHTTRHTSLLYVAENTYIIDTPGFSSLYIDDIEEGRLQEYYPEFSDYREKCRFAGCAHIKEPDCAVRDALKAGDIAPERYESYCRLYAEAASRKKY